MYHRVRQPLSQLQTVFKLACNQDLDPVRSQDGAAHRPTEQDVLLLGIFLQLWGSTATGFKAQVAGQAMTYAHTFVLQGPEGDVAVYFSDRLAYKLSPVQVASKAFEKALSEAQMPGQSDAEVIWGLT